MTRRDIITDIFNNYEPNLVEVNFNVLPVTNRINLLKDKMFIYPEQYDNKDIIKLRNILRFLNKKGYF